ncbi:SseB family protein [Nocardioides sp. BP30]|uniref:SseB family protein n=1 Tax=Nocardioides sp. BP30 TaxID=3036374 RepID=UPI0024697BB0|nr:SseB family protein [Nocardioides sp. BP30]WGL50493.1 SseB family protein [Nocardioides sp. BP30]
MHDHDTTSADQRRLQAPAFPDDDGAAAAQVGDALAAYAADRAAYPQALAAIAESRLLVPVVAVLGAVEYDAQGLAHDKTSDMATVLLTGADGRQALLAFTSMETMAAWRADARPVPVPARDAARAALQEGAAAVVVDVAGPTTLAIEGEDLRAMAHGWRLTWVGEKTAWVAPV